MDYDYKSFLAILLYKDGSLKWHINLFLKDRCYRAYVTFQIHWSNLSIYNLL